jgi:hypothetical protein
LGLAKFADRAFIPAMDAEIQRLQSELASAEAEIHRLGKAVHDLESLFAGKTQTPIRVPSGVDGINFTYEVMAQQIGAEEAAAAEGCNSFNLYTETVGSTVKLMVGAGQIGTQYFTGKELGTLSLKHGHIVYLEVDLDGTDGTYTVDVKTAADMPAASDTKKELVIGIVTATGAVLQSICGPYDVIVCRDWFVASAPFYTVSIRHTYNPMTFV